MNHASRTSPAALPPSMDFGSSWYAAPAWVTGHISGWDAKFLHALIERERPSLVVEIGTASGFSTAIIARSLDQVAGPSGGTTGFRLVTYDVAERFYADPSRRVGDATREMLAADLLARVEFRNPRDATDAARDFARDEVPFCFIDANHLHPWPALDLLSVIDMVRPGGTVVLHDVNLPSLPSVAANPQWAVHGVEWLFRDLDLAKEISTDPDGPPNIGSVRMPGDKARLRRQLLDIIHAHPWESAVDDRDLERRSLRRAGGPIAGLIRRLRRRFGHRPEPISKRLVFR